MKVLIACEESQTVCAAMRERGHEAYSADIQKPSGGHPEWHFLGDVLPLINGRCSFRTMDGVLHRIDGKWDLLIAHPPCTYLSAAGAPNLAPHGKLDHERLQNAIAAKDFFLSFYYAECEHICIENPAPLKCFNLPKYTQIVEPYFFGDPWKKRTCLWLIGLPPLVQSNVVEPKGCWVNSTGRTCRTKLLEVKGVHSAKLRSKTFPGIAQAMAEQWTSELRHGSDNLQIMISTPLLP